MFKCSTLGVCVVVVDLVALPVYLFHAISMLLILFLFILLA